MQDVDSLIHARWIAAVEPDDRVLENHSCAIKDGRIAAICPQDEALATYRASQEIHRPQHLLIPGLINAHTHAAMSLMRGMADDLPLMDWLTKHIWPAETVHMGSDFVRAGTELACLEMIQGGITCFNDMYFFPDVAAETAVRCGMRSVVGMIIIDFPTAWASNADEYFRKGTEVRDRFRHEPLISTVFAPHAPYTVSDEPLIHLQTLADELEIPVHMHVHETAGEIAESVEQHQVRPLQRLDKLGLLTPNMIAVHMTQLSDAEIQRCAETGIHVVHCPESNLKLASGFSPVAKLIEAGINVSIGTDGAASNNDLDMLGEMRTAALLAKGVSGDATALPASTVLRMATLNAANALGLGDKIGSLLPGKAADISCIDLSSAATQPVYDPVSHLIYCASRNDVSDVWVQGKQLLANKQVTTIDAKRVLAEAATWQTKLQGLAE